MNKLFFILPLIVLSLILAVWGGLIRIGWALPGSTVSGHHGAIMVGSFLSSLIFLERAVTFKQKAILLLPFLNVFSLVLFTFNAPLLAQGFLVLGSAGFLIMCIYFAGRYREFYYYVFLVGAFCLLMGNVILYKTHFYPNATPWWMGFLIFTILAERLELSRFLSISKHQKIFLIIALAALFISLWFPFHNYGRIFFSLAVMAVAGWLLKNDMAWHSLKIKGQHRYSALLLITGYGWLFITSFLLLLGEQMIFNYDAVLHSFFIGFVFSMIFSHAPIILPAVLKWPVKIYRSFLYYFFGVLQFSLIIRLVSDIAAAAWLRKAGAMLNGITILGFFIAVFLVVKAERKRQSQKS